MLENTSSKLEKIMPLKTSAQKATGKYTQTQDGEGTDKPKARNARA
jgi:hypothetical protein